MEKQTRLYGLDVLKIICMVLITFIHLSYTGILKSDNLLLANKISLVFMDTLTIFAVNCFIMITGYFQCERKVNHKRVFNLWFNVILISLILLVVMAIIDASKISAISIIKSIFPVSTMHYWFLIAYIVLCLSAPLLNTLITNISQKTHFYICLVGFLLFSIYYVTNPLVNQADYIGSTRGILWFYYLYIVAAYIKKYDLRIKKAILVLMSVIVFIIAYSLKFIGFVSWNQAKFLLDYSVLPFILTICVFLIFKSFKFNNKIICKLISVLSSCAFYVYIIQEHDAVRGWFWNIIKFSDYANSLMLIPLVFALVLALWIPALLTDILLKHLAPVSNKICDIIAKLISIIDKKIEPRFFKKDIGDKQ